LAVAGAAALVAERAASCARVAGATAKVTSAMHAASIARRTAAMCAEIFACVAAGRTFLRAAQERSEKSALAECKNCGVIIGITSGQAPQPTEWKQAILGYRRSQHETECARKFSTESESVP
jgi:hypothetical protein